MSRAKSTTTLAAVLALSALGLACGALRKPAPPDQPPADPPMKKAVEVTPAMRELARSNADFALDLYARLRTEKEGKNLFFSPYSISGALAMVIEGARGETADEMGKALRYPSSLRKEGPELPWDTAPLHTSLAALNHHLQGGSQPPPREVRERIDNLRVGLAAANAEVARLQRSPEWKQAQAAAEQASKLAAALNRLQAQYAQYELRIANALWGEKTYPFQQSYLDTLAHHYQTGGLYPVDFRTDHEAARQKINAWVEEQTNRRIKNMIPKEVLTEEQWKLVRLILTNAIYFKGEWETVFPKEQTKEEDFLLADETRVRVPVMHLDGLGQARYAAFQGDGSLFATPAQVSREDLRDPDTGYPDRQGFQLLELPYKGGTLSMVLLVPRSADGLAALEKGLTAKRLMEWVGSLKQRSLNVQLPRFKLETDYDLGEELKKMGMERAFRDPRLPGGAQFDGMTASKDPLEKLYISRVLHKAFVEVNEKGTEAAAATAVIMAKPTSAPASIPFVPTVRADRPFLFLIRDVPTGSILFLGRVTNPRPAS